MEDQGLKYVIDALANTELAKRLETYKVVIKCPICSEGNKHRTHGHCYIGLIKDGPPLVYHCFINECSGIVTPTFLRDCGIDDNELATYLDLFNKTPNTNLSKEERKIRYAESKKKDLIIPDIEDTENNKRKLMYISGRIGIKFSYENIKSLRIVFSLKDFLKINDINPSNKYKKFINTIDRDYLGFLSFNNEFIVFRNTVDNDNLRYIKYDIFGSIETSNIFYNLPGVNCNLFADDITLNICEGTFDALGIFCNVNNFNRDNNIYCAVCGSNYVNAIKYFIKMGFIGNLHVRVYSDKDKKPNYYYKRVYLKIKPWIKSFEIFYNNKSKDFGVRKEEIETIQAKKELMFERETKGKRKYGN